VESEIGLVVVLRVVVLLAKPLLSPSSKRRIVEKLLASTPDIPVMEKVVVAR
jgi:hypothetical protein